MKTNCLLETNLPSISTESERFNLYLERENYDRSYDLYKCMRSLSTEDINILSLKLESLSDDATFEDFELSLEDLTADNKNILRRIGKAVKNIVEDIKSIKENFTMVNIHGIKNLGNEIKEIAKQTSYSDPGVVNDQSILKALSCYNTLGVCNTYDAKGFIDYHDWSVGQIRDSHAANSIHDFIFSFLFQSDEYKKKGSSTKYLDRIKNREIRDWLSKDTECGVVARIAGPNTYIVSIKDAGVFETLTSRDRLLFSTSVMRTDNYSAISPNEFKSLPQKDIETIKQFLLKNEKTVNGFVEQWEKFTLSRLSYGMLIKLILKLYIAYKTLNIVSVVGHLRTYDKLMSDFVNSYIKYIRTIIDICKLHS